MELKEALENLSHLDDNHFTKGGLPDLNHLKEATGGNVTRGDVEALIGKKTRTDYEGEALVDKPPVDPETGEPDVDAEEGKAAIAEPHKASPAVVAATMIEILDQLALMLTAEVRQKQPEIAQVLQLYQAERPSIVERQKRLAVRANR